MRLLKKQLALLLAVVLTFCTVCTVYADEEPISDFILDEVEVSDDSMDAYSEDEQETVEEDTVYEETAVEEDAVYEETGEQNTEEQKTAEEESYFSEDIETYTVEEEASFDDNEAADDGAALFSDILSEEPQLVFEEEYSESTASDEIQFASEEITEEKELLVTEEETEEQETADEPVSMESSEKKIYFSVERYFSVVGETIDLYANLYGFENNPENVKFTCPDSAVILNEEDIKIERVEITSTESRCLVSTKVTANAIGEYRITCSADGAESKEARLVVGEANKSAFIKSIKVGTDTELLYKERPYILYSESYPVFIEFTNEMVLQEHAAVTVYDNGEFFMRLPIEQSNSYEDDGKAHLTSTTSMNFTLSKTIPMHEYSIKIEDKAFRVISIENVFDPHFNWHEQQVIVDYGGWKIGDYGFKTTPDYFARISNPTDRIKDSIYESLFPPKTAESLKEKETGESGVCYGWSATLGASERRYPQITKVKNGRRLVNLDKGEALDYIHLSHLTQCYTYSRAKKAAGIINYNLTSTAISLADLYSYMDGGSPVALNLISLKNGQHAVYPFDARRDAKGIYITVIDPNGPSISDITIPIFGILTGRIELHNRKSNVNTSYSSLYLSQIDEGIDEKYGQYKSGLKNSEQGTHWLMKLLSRKTSIIEDTRNRIFNSTFLYYLLPCHSAYEDVSDHRINLYWVDDEASSFTESFDSGEEISFNDGYNEYKFVPGVKSNVTMNFKGNQMTISPVKSGARIKGTFTYSKANDYNDSEDIRFYVDSDKKVVFTKTKNGIIINGTNLKDVKVTYIHGNVSITKYVSSDYGKIDANINGGNFKVVVDDGQSASIKLNKSSATTYVGTTATIKATVTGKSKTVEWTSSNKGVATVKDGVVTGVKAGTATITAKANGKTATCKVTVKNPEVILSATSFTMYVGDKYTIKAEVHGKSNTIIWKSKNTSIATVNSKGVVTGKKAGKTAITATANGVTVQFNLTVKAGISASKLKMHVGDKKTLKLYGTKIKSVKSSNTKVATVSSQGVVKALKKGSATITLTGQNNFSYKCTVTVE